MVKVAQFVKENCCVRASDRVPLAFPIDGHTHKSNPRRQPMAEFLMIVGIIMLVLEVAVLLGA